MEADDLHSLSTHLFVLVVDDEADTAEMYVVALKFAECEPTGDGDDAHVSESGRNGHRTVSATNFTLRNGDGWDFLRLLRDNSYTSDIPVVVLTGCAAPALRDRAEREGCTAVIIKPSSPCELAAQLRDILNRSTSFFSPAFGQSDDRVN